MLKFKKLDTVWVSEGIRKIRSVYIIYSYPTDYGTFYDVEIPTSYCEALEFASLYSAKSFCQAFEDGEE